MATPGVWHVLHCAPLFFPTAGLPSLCPACHQPLPSTPAAKVPCPFGRAADHPRRVLLRPTDADWLQYAGGDLHAGVTDAHGAVLAFDRDGLVRQPAAQWPRCLVVRVAGVDDAAWDGALAAVRPAQWPADTYDETRRNCLSFVLALLSAACGASAAPWTRERFAREWILPESRRAAKYLTLLRRARQHGWYRLDAASDAPPAERGAGKSSASA